MPAHLRLAAHAAADAGVRAIRSFSATRRLTNDEVYWLRDGRLPDRHGAGCRALEGDRTGSGGHSRSRLILCGHSHIARAVRLGDGRLIVNPGSVGSPGYRDTFRFRMLMEAGTPDARYAILELITASWRVTFRHVPYDHDAMAALARRNGEPELAAALATGWIRRHETKRPAIRRPFEPNRCAKRIRPQP